MIYRHTYILKCQIYQIKLTQNIKNDYINDI